jgi:hypothetical protein
MSAFALQPGEKLLINDPHAKWFMLAAKGVEGRIRLTQNRFVFEVPEHAYFSAFKFMFKGLDAKTVLEIKRSEITGATKVEGVGGKSRLQIETKYERPKTFETMKMDTIIGELSKTIVKPE